jgi:peptide deformylase
MYGDVSRPDVVDVTALDKEGKPIAFRCGGLLSRAIQHETDHLHGILFIDRMDKKTLEELRPELDDLQAATKAAMKRS